MCLYMSTVAKRRSRQNVAICYYLFFLGHDYKKAWKKAWHFELNLGRGWLSFFLYSLLILQSQSLEKVSLRALDLLCTRHCIDMTVVTGVESFVVGLTFFMGLMLILFWLLLDSMPNFVVWVRRPVIVNETFHPLVRNCFYGKGQ